MSSPIGQMLTEAVVILLALGYVAGQSSDKCQEASTCTDCMSRGPSCSWCYSEAYKDESYGKGYRCAEKDLLIERGCPSGEITSEPSTMHPVNDAPNVNRQLTPSNIIASVRPNDNYEVQFTFTPIENYPVDLYVLMDMSYTMAKFRTAASDGAVDIFKKMQEVTTQFKIGFGSFVDKPMVPFIESTDMRLVESPCTKASTTVTCVPTYLYKHELSMTDNIQKFKDVTKNAAHSGNLDAPEGGLDALLQVAHCDNIINWSPGARRIVMVASDGTFHLAGDGRLAGLIAPPPRTCQVTKASDFHNSTNMYMGWHNSTFTDYPSVGELARVLAEKDIAVIFASPETTQTKYKTLVQHLTSASYGVLKDDSSDLVDFLKENYRKIASTIQLSVSKPTNSTVTLKLLTKCAADVEFEEKPKCEDQPINGKVEYKLQITPTSCMDNPEAIQLNVAGLNVKSIITLSTPCNCKQCSQVPGTSDSSACNMRGNFECGVCKCSGNYMGEFCECSTQGSQVSEAIQEEKCKQTNTSDVCSGRGRCSCGKCICHQEEYEGNFCECDKLACPRSTDDGKVCGGSARGTCNCDGTCTCKPEYKEKACDCIKSDERCRDPKASVNASKALCSGQGVCDCGICFCKNGWTGFLCNEPQGGEGAFCTKPKEISECVICLQTAIKGSTKEKKKKSKDTESVPVSEEETRMAVVKCNDICNTTVIDMKSIIFTNEMKQQEGDSANNFCISYTDKQCRVSWSYKYKTIFQADNKIEVMIDRRRTCPTETNVMWIIIGVVLGIILIGLLLLAIWKLVVTIDDRRELAKFNKEEKVAKWEMEENPIFLKPVTTVNNPMYTGGQD